ncbi:FAD-binding oxidoreductase [Pseudonocardia spinosispora]|uniref:FAD-binding oxidoreductase n=1 Tax=Pseudonocardia spinosispora TaxID=103441 RepID=UPI0003FCBB56|nr:FAD-binding oxidoreductase [Pseudonocardia spinosispora]
MSSFNELISQVDGPVQRPGDAGYDTERSGFQASYRHEPSVVVGATGVDDVCAAVRHAAANDLPVAVQSTGHGLAVPTEGGVLVSTRRMTGVRIDPAARTARIAAGTRWGEVVAAAAAHGLAPLSGSSSEVGAVGYTLGGGLGVLSREFGYAADHLRSVELVTADGTVRHVDESHDLHWALAGAGGNFGVATSAEIGLVPVSRVYGGGLYFDTAHVPAALDTWRSWVQTVPEQLTSSIALIPIPDLPMVPEPLRGRYVAHIRVAFTGDAERGEELVAPLRAIGPRLIDTLAEMPYTESPSIYNDPTQPHGYYGTNAMLDALDAGVPATVLDLVGPDAPVPCVVQINHLGGALARPPAVPNAVAHRGAEFLVRVLSVVNGPAPSVEHAAPTLLTDALKPWTIGRSPNFVFGERSTPEQAQTCYRPEDHGRLATLKAAYDPANMFRCTLNIPPVRVAQPS